MDLKRVRNVAVVGASRNPRKYGNIVLKFLLERGLRVYPVNPKYDEVEGVKCYGRISDLPGDTDLLVFIVPPRTGRELVREALAAGFRALWFQPGAWSEEIESLLRGKDVEYVYERCIMVELSGSPTLELSLDEAT